MKLAFRIGMPLEQFWRSTPFQFKCCLEAYQQKREEDHDHNAWFMWHNAALYRMKRMLPLKEFFAGNKKAVKVIDEAAIIARFKAYKKEQKDGSSSKTNG